MFDWSKITIHEYKGPEVTDIFHENHPLHHMLYWDIEEWDEAMKNYDESQS